MTRYITNDGMQFAGDNPPAAIDALRGMSLRPGRSRAEFLEIILEGARLQTGLPVIVTPPGDCEAVLSALIELGLVTPLDDTIANLDRN